jgi:hypothetical protein
MTGALNQLAQLTPTLRVAPPKPGRHRITSETKQRNLATEMVANRGDLAEPARDVK